MLKSSVPDFSFDHYRFFLYDQSDYLEQFTRESRVQEFKIRKQLTELVYIQTINKLNTEFPNLPKSFFDNKVKWCNLLMKTKKVQHLFSEFSQAIAKSLEAELKTNRELIDKYLRHPRPHTQNKDMLEGVQLYKVEGAGEFQTWEEKNRGRKIIPKMHDYKLVLEQHKARMAAGKAPSPNGKRDPLHGLSPA